MQVVRRSVVGGAGRTDRVAGEQPAQLGDRQAVPPRRPAVRPRQGRPAGGTAAVLTGGRGQRGPVEARVGELPMALTATKAPDGQAATAQPVPRARELYRFYHA